MKCKCRPRTIAIFLASGSLFFAAGWYFGSVRSSGIESDASSARNGVKAATANAPQSNRNAVQTDGTKLPEDIPQMVELLRSPDKIGRIQTWARMLQAADADGVENMRQALERFYESGALVPDEESAMIHYRLGQVFGAKHIVSGLPLEPNGRIAENHLRMMRGWADADTKAARAWVDKLPAGSAKQTLLNTWFQGASASHPEQAEALFASLPESGRAPVLQAMIGAVRHQSGVDGLVQWFDRTAANPLPGVPLRETFDKVGWIVGQQAKTNPDLLQKFLHDPAHAAWLNPGAFAAVTRNIATHTPGVAIEMLADLSAGPRPFSDEEVRTALRETASRARRDAINGLAQWLNQNPTHQYHDLTIRYFVEQAVLDDPAAAAAWTKKISDPALREETEQFLPH